MDGLFNLQRTVLYGELRLDVYSTQGSRTYYRLVNESPWHPGVLLDFEIGANGRRYDYLRMDKFWGRVPRPFMV